MASNFINSVVNSVIPRVMSCEGRRVVFLITTLMEVGQLTSKDFAKIHKIAQSLNLACEDKSVSFAITLKPVVWYGETLKIRPFNDDPIIAYGEMWGLAARIVGEQPYWTKYDTRENVINDVQKVLIETVRIRYNDPTIADMEKPSQKSSKKGRSSQRS